MSCFYSQDDILFSCSESAWNIWAAVELCLPLHAWAHKAQRPFNHGTDILGLQGIPVGAEIEGIGADDLEELSEDENEYYKLGAENEEFKDYKNLGLKLDHANR